MKPDIVKRSISHKLLTKDIPHKQYVRVQGHRPPMHVLCVCVSQHMYIYIHSWQKGCYTPIEDNKTNVDRTFVFPLGWNWHDMDPWLFPNEIPHYLGQTFNARSSGIVELRNHSIGGRSPQSIFTPWQLWINIAYFFKSFSDCPNNAPSNPYGY